MPQGDAERLVVQLEARIRDFERNMAKASGTATRQYGQIERRSRSTTRRMETDMIRSTGRINRALASTSSKIGMFAKSVLPVAAVASPFIAVASAINGAKSAMVEFDRIGKTAKAAGLNAEFFQELAYSAELGGVSFEQLSSALEAFNRNAGRAAANKGELVENLKVLHPELLKNIQAARSQEERIKLVADALREESDASRRAAIAAAAFGRAGVKMVEVLKGGADELARTAQKARELGIVVDNELIARAEDLNDEFTTATKVMDIQFKQTLIDLAPILIESAKWAGNLARAIRDISDAMQSLEGPGAGRGGNQSLYEHLRATDPKAWNQLRSDIQGAFYDVPRTDFYEGFNFGPDGNILVDRGGSSGGSGGGSSGSRNDAAAKAIKEAEAVQQLIDGLEFELSLIGRTDTEKRVMNELRAAGAAATDKEREQIVELVQAIKLENTEIERMKDLMQEAEGMAQSFASSLVDDLLSGATATEALSNAFRNLASQLLKMATNQLISSMFDSFGLPGAGQSGFTFGGARAEGGPVSSGRAYLVGERGPELFMPRQSGAIVPNQSLAASSNTGGQITVSVSTEVRNGNLVPTIAKVSGEVAGKQIKQQVPAMIRRGSGPAVLAAQRNREVR
ncbi:phage tail tape measure protein [Cucumibacter marinus]|uniref:phage tail tape measure protein n=1 Tax=Cucumibacter marinus TaxID=1121252 RepID=UPI000407EEC0|nr:phage tail tape measure protein [Cucumibacter marinus]